MFEDRVEDEEVAVELNAEVQDPTQCCDHQNWEFVIHQDLVKHRDGLK